MREAVACRLDNRERECLVSPPGSDPGRSRGFKSHLPDVAETSSIGQSNRFGADRFPIQIRGLRLATNSGNSSMVERWFGEPKAPGSSPGSQIFIFWLKINPIDTIS